MAETGNEKRREASKVNFCFCIIIEKLFLCVSRDANGFKQGCPKKDGRDMQSFPNYLVAMEVGHCGNAENSSKKSHQYCLVRLVFLLYS